MFGKASGSLMYLSVSETRRVKPGELQVPINEVNHPGDDDIRASLLWHESSQDVKLVLDITTTWFM